MNRKFKNKFIFKSVALLFVPQRCFYIFSDLSKQKDNQKDLSLMIFVGRFSKIFYNSNFIKMNIKA
jgi:hypothetical protein